MQDLNPVDNYLHGSWEALGNGAPMLVALAQLCSESWVRKSPAFGDRQMEDPALINEQLDGLLPEAKAILFAARNRGIIEIRAVNSAFDAAARLLAVYVELDEDRTIAFRDPSKPATTVRFLEGFRNLCSQGLVIHHIFGDFSLAPRALQIADLLKRDELQDLLELATEFGLHD